MSAIVPKNGPTRQLDQPAEPDEQLTEAEVQQPETLTRLLRRLLRDVASLKRLFVPERVDFEDRTVDATGTTPIRFTHGFGGRVRWWVVDWVPDSAGTRPNLWRSSADENTLVLLSGAAGVATVRVEAAG